MTHIRVVVKGMGPGRLVSSKARGRVFLGVLGTDLAVISQSAQDPASDTKKLSERGCLCGCFGVTEP